MTSQTMGMISGGAIPPVEHPPKETCIICGGIAFKGLCSHCLAAAVRYGERNKLPFFAANVDDFLQERKLLLEHAEEERDENMREPQAPRGE